MQFNLSQSIEILERTPEALKAILEGLSAEWVEQNEGPETFSPFDVVGHLIHGERTDWIPRLQMILSQDPATVFEPFDRFAMYEASRGKSLAQLLETFKLLRNENLATLKALRLSGSDLDRKGQHPELGEVTAQELLATWTVHDLNHIAQISRVMAHQYRCEVGSWQAYLRILGS